MTVEMQQQKVTSIWSFCVMTWRFYLCLKQYELWVKFFLFLLKNIVMKLRSIDPFWYHNILIF